MTNETSDQIRVTRAPEVGGEAPDFELRDDAGEVFKLSDYRGKKNVLVLFYPVAFSRGCQGEFCTLRDENADIVSDEDVEVVGISVDSGFALRAWKAQQSFQNRFLSDFWPHGQVCRLYGAFDQNLGIAHRHTFLIDKQGVVRYVERNMSHEIRDQSAWRDALATIG